jgi:hypothetical protein
MVYIFSEKASWRVGLEILYVEIPKTKDVKLNIESQKTKVRRPKAKS